MKRRTKTKMIVKTRCGNVLNKTQTAGYFSLLNPTDVVEEHKILLEQLKKVNTERAVAVKALQEIELYLMKLPIQYENFTLAYMIAIEALTELGEDK